MSGDPFPKEKQLARGARKYRRKIASEKQWQAIIEAKMGPCRVLVQPATNGGAKLTESGSYPVQFHHVVPRDFGGDDVADNIVPVSNEGHDLVTRRDPEACKKLCASLTDAEYAYVIGKLGESAFERIYGLVYGR